MIELIQVNKSSGRRKVNCNNLLATTLLEKINLLKGLYHTGPYKYVVFQQTELGLKKKMYPINILEG